MKFILLSILSFAQTDSNKICFEIKEAKFLLKQSFENVELKRIISIYDFQFELKDSIIENQKIQRRALESILKNKDEEIALGVYVEGKLKESLDNYQKKYRRQKVYKNISIGGGVVGIALMGYLLLKG